MKAMLQGVKRRFSSEKNKTSFDNDPSASGASGANGTSNGNGASEGIENKDLPIFRMSRKVDKSVFIDNLPSFKETSAKDREALLLRKLRMCCYVFDFTNDDPNSEIIDAKEKEIKRATLMELVDYLNTYKPVFSDTALNDIFDMVQSNMFRPLPPRPQETGAILSPEEDEPNLEPSWPHLQIVYEFLLRLVASPDADLKKLKKFIESKFVVNLLELFDSEDPRERDYLKTILHRIYAKFMSLRPFIRKAINNVFYKFVYETDRHNGIAEFLEILGSIINGFALPLKGEHVTFLKNVLLPLHKASNVNLFHPQLTYCVTQFMEKDPGLAEMVLGAVLKYWPIVASKKELLFLNELEEIAERIKPEFASKLIIPLFSQIAHSLDSPHFQVAEKAIYMLNNETLSTLISNNRQVLIPILINPLYRNCNNTKEPASTAAPGKSMASGTRGTSDAEGQGHWNPVVSQLVTDVLKAFSDMDRDLVNQCIEDIKAKSQAAKQSREQRSQLWSQLESKEQPKPASNAE